MDNELTRLCIMFEKHFGFGIRWATDSYMLYPLHISIALPFITFDIGLGPQRTDAARGLA